MTVGDVAGGAEGFARAALRLSVTVGWAQARTCARLMAVQRAKLGIFRRTKGTCCAFSAVRAVAPRRHRARREPSETRWRRGGAVV